MKLRTDLLYSLIAFESVLVAVAAVLWFPTWLLAVAIATFVFATVEAVHSRVVLRKRFYDEANGKSTYRFPVGKFILLAALLACLTAAVILGVKMLFGYMLIAIACLVVVLLVLAIVFKLNLLEMICELIIAILVIILVSHEVASMVHSGVNWNPGLNTEQNQTPGDNTQTPGDDTQTPGDNTQTPGDNTQTPGDNTQTPGDNTQTPGDNTQTPGDNTQTPGDNTQTPGDNTQTPGDNTQTPGDNTQTPGDNTQTPGDNTQPPGDNTQTPGDNTQTPGDNTQTPVVTPKINAPDTMSYGKPVTITLEGIDVDNLKYGGEDFISIVKVSDTQVVLTLVGIVNDEGQVQIVPASGYITVTDSVSGTNVSIRIVE